ncbi:MAG: ion transporter [Prevotella sp.]|nr:ion transporter [Bacteroides sp.]MCM1366226.1 ion transporter [Prevotella sp.]MCM1436978.1 ion transporter [Prevotella sp.]
MKKRHTKTSPKLNFEELPRGKKIIEECAHYVVLLLSLALIIFISYDTFSSIPFLSNHTYMTFQFWVCVIFMADFFLELSFAANKHAYLQRRWFFLLISIPYLNIINLLHINLGEGTLYFIRFIPLIRGAYSMAMVVGFFSTNRAFTMLSQYAFILVSFTYFMSMIFYYEERQVNPDVLTFWDALYWACLNATTVGSDIQAVTIFGKVGTVVMSISGMMMLPLFTVYITDRVKRMNNRYRAQSDFILRQLHLSHTQNDTDESEPDAHDDKTPQQKSSPSDTVSGNNPESSDSLTTKSGGGS